MTRKTRITISAAFAILLLVCSSAATVQAQAAARLLGSITAINGNTLTVKTDAGESKDVAAPEGIPVKRIEPGQTSLAAAATIAFSDLAVGDRILVMLDPAAPTSTARQIVAIKAADMAQKQQKDREEWQRRGVAGLVKSVDAATGTITVATGAGPTAKTVTVKTTPTTVLKRYAQGSVKPEQAQAAPISAILAGDQIHAKGDKAADGSELTAEEVYSGTFKNISGTIGSIDTAAGTISIKDLATKKPFTIHFGTESQLHKLPDQMAQMLATRLKKSSDEESALAEPRPAQEGNGRRTGGGPGGGGDSQLLNRTPVIQLADLQKGQAIMVVASEAPEDGGNVNAIMLLAGVEPLLEAPAARDLLSSWSMGGGGEGGAGVP